MNLLYRHLLALCLLAAVPCATPCAAATLDVPSATYPTIQSGINAAQPGDTVLVADGTYTGPGNVDLDFGGKGITVRSVHGPASTIIDCQGSSSSPHRGFYLHSGEPATATISGFTVRNGYAPYDSSPAGDDGGIYVGSSVTVANCTVTGNTANGYGGLYVASGSTITAFTVKGNTSGGDGGLSAGSSVTVANSARSPATHPTATVEAVASLQAAAVPSSPAPSMAIRLQGLAVLPQAIAVSSPPAPSPATRPSGLPATLATAAASLRRAAPSPTAPSRATAPL